MCCLLVAEPNTIPFWKKNILVSCNLSAVQQQQRTLVWLIVQPQRRLNQLNRKDSESNAHLINEGFKHERIIAKGSSKNGDTCTIFPTIAAPTTAAVSVDVNAKYENGTSHPNSFCAYNRSTNDDWKDNEKLMVDPQNDWMDVRHRYWMDQDDPPTDPDTYCKNKCKNHKTNAEGNGDCVAVEQRATFCDVWDTNKFDPPSFFPEGGLNPERLGHAHHSGYVNGTCHLFR